MKNKIAVIGGTGKAGKFLVNQLVKRGFTINVLVRDKTHFEINSPLITVVEGDVRDKQLLLALTTDCYAILSTLGQTKGENKPIFSEVAHLMLQVMKDQQINRYVVVGGLSIDINKDPKSARTLQLTNWMKENFPAITADRQKEYNIIAESAIDYTFLRLPMIEQSDIEGKLKIDENDCNGNKINAIDLANFMIDQLVRTDYIQKAPFIWSE